MSTAIYENSDNSFTVVLNGTDSIRTTVTASGADVEAWIADIHRIHQGRLSHLLVGLDAEWRPSFSANIENPTALLQLCVGRRCLLFQLLHADYIPCALSSFLQDSRFTFVGVAVENDADRLRNELNMQFGRLVDLRDLAAEKMGRPEMRQVGLARLASVVMGVNLRKSNVVRTGAWDLRDLSLEQIQYAAVDGFVSFEIGRRLYCGEF